MLTLSAVNSLFQAHTVMPNIISVAHDRNFKILPLSTMWTIQQPQDKMAVPYGMPM
jgi:hypothetical protein